jgi:acetyl esterase/lipase
MSLRKLVSPALAVALLITVVPAQKRTPPTPPAQPASGPGGKQLPHQAVIKNRYGKGGTEYWIFEPGNPKPKSAPVVIFLHGWGGTNPLYYGAWIDHIVRRGNIVIYPRYQSSILTRREDFIPNTVKALQSAFQRLRTEKIHAQPELDKIATVGHSLGGVLAASVAALAAESKLPAIRAVMSVEPGITRKPVSVPMADLSKIPGDSLLLAVAGDRDTLVEDFDAKRIYYESTRVGPNNKDFIRLISDDRGMPGLFASHRAPTAPDESYDNGEGDMMDRVQGSGGQTRSDGPIVPSVNALDFYGLWKLFDGLCDAAFFKKNREYALGNTPQQRFMGKWSDGVPVKELFVTDEP